MPIHSPDKHPAAELVNATVVPQPGDTHAVDASVPVVVTPTQMRRPWRSTLRTAVQSIIALAVLFPVLVQEAGLDADRWPWLAIPLTVAAVVARVMANPQVELFLRRFLPWLAAAPKPKS